MRTGWFSESVELKFRPFPRNKDLKRFQVEGDKEMARRILAVEYLSVAALKPNAQNPRLHTDKQLRQIANSIRSFGFNVPVLVDTHLQVIAGHGRVLACKILGITEVPTIRLEHLSENQLRAFTIADNRLTENAEWDNRLLGEQLKILSEVELDFSLEVTGFETSEIDIFIENLAPAIPGEVDPADAVPDSEAKTQVTEAGDCWALNRHRAYCGDARNDFAYSALMAGRRAAMVFTDPPYNDPIDGYVTGFGKIHHPEFAVASGEMTAPEFTDFLTKSMAQASRNSADGALQFICMDWRHSAELISAARSVYSEFTNVCVWVKENAGQGSLYRSQHEFVFVFKNGKKPHRNNIQLGQYGRYRTNVWNYRRANSLSRSNQEGALSHLHPTIKPVQLVADAILDCTARGDIVLDAFLGSGTTMIAAERTGRICYGMELDPRYVDMIVRRWQCFTGIEAVHEATGQTFAEREEEIINARQ
jgi:DNA modification methylase